MNSRRFSCAASIAALACALALVPGAFAGKGGGLATLTFAPATTAVAADAAIAVGQQYRVNGSGFKPNTWVTVGAHYADTTWWNYQVTDSLGNFSLVFTATSAGQIYHEAKEQGKHDRLRLVAGATLTVDP
jgi:hypothetical protein